jgi:3,4-dihydroxy 2-butanone 4-phosphate synthase/GTP cyclohydrolase II
MTTATRPEIHTAPTGIEVASLHQLARADLPTAHGTFTAFAFMNGTDATEHLVLLWGPIRAHDVLVRVHSECLTGDVLGSLRCDCGEQLDSALAAITAEGAGVLVYLRGHEGRGIGLEQKLRAYALQEQGMDTVEANLALGLPVDCRAYAPAAALLHHLGIRTVRLLSNNPDKAAALAVRGIVCGEMVPMPSTVTAHNQRYLSTNRLLLGHAGLAAPPHSTQAAAMWKPT